MAINSVSGSAVYTSIDVEPIAKMSVPGILLAVRCLVYDIVTGGQEHIIAGT